MEEGPEERPVEEGPDERPAETGGEEGTPDTGKVAGETGEETVDGTLADARIAARSERRGAMIRAASEKTLRVAVS